MESIQLEETTLRNEDIFNDIDKAVLATYHPFEDEINPEGVSVC